MEDGPAGTAFTFLVAGAIIRQLLSDGIGRPLADDYPQPSL